ncbi:hypothetical protein LQ327_25610 [Actinomycetospora endophytica]|uniref:Uncharacterized protein n=1 Tax=Actinomycetospora endophytica TaxID=2291215 RepID=A0ABS8PES0_9PSEU|nr:hypothetical protein [Actinomycetospora endophytica]MCD2196752.1 hypothetical protein [Actinomycetospora endophytica]
MNDVMRCVGCGEELLAERAELGYEYCLAPACQGRYRQGPAVTAVGVNKSGESFVVAEPEDVRRRAEAGEFAAKNAAVLPTPASGVPRQRTPQRRRPSTPPKRPWTPEQENLVRIYHEMGLSPREIVERCRTAAPRLGVDERLVVQILSSPRPARR